MILYCAADLIWATRIKATADALGIPCRPVRNVEMLKARLTDSKVRAVILDLETPEMSLAILRTLRGTPGEPATDPGRTIRVLAFGPHVATDLFEQARAAGADRVLARGAFDRALPEILQDLEGSPA
jgi:CheY-like chemotaxis protein